MTLTRRQRWSAVVLLVALAALALDKLILSSEPASASAAVELSPQNAVEAADRDRGKPDETLAAAQRIFQRMNGRSSLSEIKSLFGLSKNATASSDVFNWQRISGAEMRGQADRPEAERSAKIEAFKLTHRLTATLLGPRPMALIGGRLYQVGESIDGFVLERISQGRAEFVSDGNTVVLSVARAWEIGESNSP